MKTNISIKQLEKSKLYSEELGINLKSKNDEEIFKWFLASILFGARISETNAKNTYKAFERYNLLEPEKILNVGRDFLVNPVMREGGYVHYDFKTSTKILQICEKLVKEYQSSLNKLHEEAKNSKDLEKRLSEFYGIGPTTLNIFLREMRLYWEKADPPTLAIVKAVAEKINLDLKKYNRKSLTFVRIESGLIRLRRAFKE
jgi:endonuclease III